jgi:predicted secreted protein
MSRDISTFECKDEDHKTAVVGSYEWSISCDAMYPLNYTAADAWSTLYDAFIAGTSVTLKFALASGTASNIIGYTGSAYISSFNIDAPHGNGTTASVEFVGSGAITEVAQPSGQ